MGILDDAEVNVNDVSDDPYGFGKEAWPLEIVSVDEPRVSKTGAQFGMMIKFRCVHPDYADIMDSLGNGQWWRLPCPKAKLNELNEPIAPVTANLLVNNWIQLLTVLGFSKDVMGKVTANDIVGRRLMGKVKPELNEEYGNYGFRCFGFKAMPSEGTMEGLNAFAQPAAPKSNGKGGNAVKGSDLDAFEAALGK